MQEKASSRTYHLEMLARNPGIPQESLIRERFGDTLELSSHNDVTHTYRVHNLKQEPNRATLMSWVAQGDIIGFICYDKDWNIRWAYPV